MGQSFRMLEETGRYANMTGFANDLIKNNAPIGSGVTKFVDKQHGFEFLLGLHEAPYLEINEGSLLSTGQSREAGVWLSDVLKRNGGAQRLVAPVENSDEKIDLNLEVKDGLLFIQCSYPSEKDLNDLPRVWLTNDEVPWDPKVLEEEDTITIPSCWDGESEFLLATNTESEEPSTINSLGDYHLQNLRATLYLLQTIYPLKIPPTIYRTQHNIQKKIVSASTLIKKLNYEELRTLLGWLPLEVVKRTFECTTQLAMGSMLHLPFRQHHKYRTPQLNVPRLAETFATDNLFSSEVGLGGITCAQLFVGTQSKLTKVFGMRSENEGT